MSSNVRAGIVFEDPKTLEARRVVATNCIRDLGLKLPAYLDDMDDSAMKAYAAWPNRVYVIGGDGLVAWMAKGGPMGVIGVPFEKGLEEVLSGPGGGRFSEIPPNVGVLRAIPVGPDDLRAPDGFSIAREGAEIVLRTGRRGGASFEIDARSSLDAARGVLANLGVFGRPGPDERIVPSSLVALGSDGKESVKTRSKLFRLRHEHAFRNVRLDGDHVDVVFDMLGVREIRFAWHRIAAGGSDGGEARLSSLAAARSVDMMKAVARLRYLLRVSGDAGLAFRPVWRLEQGPRIRDVDVIR